MGGYSAGYLSARIRAVMALVSVLFVLLLNVGKSTGDSYEVYQSPIDVQISAVLTDVCDINSKAEITARWKEPNALNGNVSHYEIQHRGAYEEDWSHVIETSNNFLVINNITAEGNHIISLVAIYENGGKSEKVEANASLSDLITKPVVTIDIHGNVAKWNYYICDKPSFRVKEKTSVSSKWNKVDVTDGIDGVEFIFKDGKDHQVCIDILVNSRVYSQICHSMPSTGITSSKTEKDGAYVWVIVGVVGAIVVLIAVFAVISFFMLCKQRGNAVPVATFSKQTFSSGRFSKRNYSEKALQREHVPLNPMSRSPATQRSDENRLGIYHKHSPNLSVDGDDNSDKDEM